MAYAILRRLRSYTAKPEAELCRSGDGSATLSTTNASFQASFISTPKRLSSLLEVTLRKVHLSSTRVLGLSQSAYVSIFL
jgi:hypothetical protein